MHHHKIQMAFRQDLSIGSLELYSSGPNFIPPYSLYSLYGIDNLLSLDIIHGRKWLHAVRFSSLIDEFNLYSPDASAWIHLERTFRHSK